MACPSVEQPSSTSFQHNDGESNKSNTTPTITDLRKRIRDGIFELPLYNFEIKSDETNPPFPRMTSSLPASNSALSPDFPFTYLDHEPSLSRHAYLLSMRRGSHGLPISARYYKHASEFDRLNKMDGDDNDTNPLNELKNLEKGHLCFVGPAGSGKSTLLRVLARNCIDGANEYDKVDLVHFIHPKSFRGENLKKCNARDAIFSCDANGAAFTKEESEYLFLFASSDPGKLILIFDSLDTLPKELDEIENSIDNYDAKREYKPMVHLKMLLCGELFEGCRVITSSRPHAIRNFTNDMNPTAVVSLLGFSKSDAKKVLDMYAPDNSNEIFKVIEDKPHFLSLFREPVFLVYLVKIWRTIVNSRYMCVTEVMTEVVNSFYENQHGHKRGEYENFDQMKKLARRILWAKKLDFDEKTLSNYGLKIRDLTDLCTTVLGKDGKQIKMSLTKGTTPIIFSHQSIQEILSALEVMESNFNEFEEKINVINQPFFHKARQFLYGLAFQQDCTPAFKEGSADFSDIEKKREVLRSSIEEESRNAQGFELLSIFETLAEAITQTNQFDLKLTHGADFSHVPLNNWSMYCTGIAISKFDILQLLHLETCSIRPSHLRVLKDGLSKYNNKHLQILSFSLRGNKDIGREGIKVACEIVRERKVNSFNVGRCELNTDCMTELSNGIAATKISSLVLDKNAIGEEGMKIAGEIARSCLVDKINLTGCAKTYEEAAAFGKASLGSHIDELIVMDRDGETVSGYGTTIQNSHLKTLVVPLSAIKSMDTTKVEELSRCDGKISKLLLTLNSKHLLDVENTGQIDENTCDSICKLIPIVENELQIGAQMESKLAGKLQKALNDLERKGPTVIIEWGRHDPFSISRSDRHGEKCILMSEKRTKIPGKDDRPEKTSNDDARKDETEILSKMEKKYMNISDGSDVIEWIKKYQDHHERDIIKIISTHGLSIFKHELCNEDCEVIVQILSKCEQQLKRFSLSHTKEIPMLLKKAKESKLQLEVNEMCFAGYHEITELQISQFIELAGLFRATGLVLRSVNGRGLDFLREQIKNKLCGDKKNNFERLEIFHNPDMSEERLYDLAMIAKDCEEKALHLAVCHCGLDDDRLQSFHEQLKSTKLGGIDVSGNGDLSSNGFETLGKIASESKVPSIRMQDCGLNAEKVEAFNTGCGEEPGLTIESIDVSNNPNLGEEGLDAIKSTVQKFNVQNLSLAYCRLEEFDLEQRQFKSLDVSGNAQLAYMEDVACLATEKFAARDCMLARSDLGNIADALKESSIRLREIDLSDGSKSIGVSGIQFYAKTFQNVADRITIHSSGMHNICIKELQERIEDYKFGVLSISPSIKIFGRRSKKQMMDGQMRNISGRRKVGQIKKCELM